MNEKLDPQLLEMDDHAARGLSDAPQEVAVLVALRQPLDEGGRSDLAARGLKLRSEVGDVLTGTIAIGDLRALADAPAVVKVESSRPMFAEPSGGGEGPGE